MGHLLGVKVSIQKLPQWETAAAVFFGARLWIVPNMIRAVPYFVLHFENHEFDIMKFKSDLAVMKTISVREMKANWSAVEAQVREGETFEVVNRGRPSVRISPALPRKILVWEDHLETAIPDAGRSAEQTVAADREGRW